MISKKPTLQQASTRMWLRRIRNAVKSEDASSAMNAIENLIQSKDDRIAELEALNKAIVLDDEKPLLDRIAELKAVAIEAWQAGFSRGHDDTVEGCFNPGWADDPGAAQEWLTEREQT